MPIYEYSCTNPDCQHVTEKLVMRYETDGEIQCGECGGCAMQVFSLPSPVQWGGKFAVRDKRREMYLDAGHSKH